MMYQQIICKFELALVGSSLCFETQMVLMIPNQVYTFLVGTSKIIGINKIIKLWK